MPRYPKWLFVLIPVLVILHLNVWMWDEDAIVLGFPVNLLYHAVLSVLLSLVMWLVIRRAWPSYLDED